MTRASVPSRTFTLEFGRDSLRALVCRIAAGDRSAFRHLYALLAIPIWQDAVRISPSPVDARAVTRSTFVEIWHLARHHLDETGPAISEWIANITARRANERFRTADAPCPLRGDHDRHTHCELVDLLSADSSTDQPWYADDPWIIF